MSVTDVRVQSDLQIKAPTLADELGARHKEVSPYAPETLLSRAALAFCAEVRQARRSLVKDKAYRATPIGGEIGHFLRSLRWASASENTLLSYESTLAKLAYDFADRELVDLTLEDLRDFLDEHWGESAAATRRQRLAVVKSFYRFCVEERGVESSPIEKIKPPKRTDVSREAYSVDIIEQLREGQPTLRDQIAIQLLGRLGLRKNELRLVQVGDFDLIHGNVKVHAKGGHIHSVPLAYPTLTNDVEVHIVGRAAKEYLLHPKLNITQPMTSVGVHLWFKRALAKAGLPETIKMHELRHSAADNLWRETGNIVHAKQLLRHRSVGTTEAYLHPSMDDLTAAMRTMGDER